MDKKRREIESKKRNRLNYLIGIWVTAAAAALIVVLLIKLFVLVTPFKAF